MSKEFTEFSIKVVAINDFRWPWSELERRIYCQDWTDWPAQHRIRGNAVAALRDKWRFKKNFASDIYRSRGTLIEIYIDHVFNRYVTRNRTENRIIRLLVSGSQLITSAVSPATAAESSVRQRISRSQQVIISLNPKPLFPDHVCNFSMMRTVDMRPNDV